MAVKMGRKKRDYSHQRFSIALAREIRQKWGDSRKDKFVDIVRNMHEALITVEKYMEAPKKMSAKEINDELKERLKVVN